MRAEDNPKVGGARRLWSQRGQAIVEFGLAATLFFTVLGTIVDIGRGVWYQGTLQDAVQEATRYAVVHGNGATSPVGPGDGHYSAGPPSTDSTLTTVVDSYATALSSSQIAVNSSWPDGDNAAGHRVTVTATYPFNPFTRVFGFFSITLSASSTRQILH